MSNKVGNRIWCWMRCFCCSRPKADELADEPNIDKSVECFYDTESIVPSDT